MTTYSDPWPLDPGQFRDTPNRKSFVKMFDRFTHDGRGYTVTVHNLVADDDDPNWLVTYWSVKIDGLNLPRLEGTKFYTLMDAHRAAKRIINGASNKATND